eukprot:scaffold2036_cov256-Pinguiococcus_pyrenoidosus.AAC.20
MQVLARSVPACTCPRSCRRPPGRGGVAGPVGIQGRSPRSPCRALRRGSSESGLEQALGGNIQIDERGKHLFAKLTSIPNAFAVVRSAD